MSEEAKRLHFSSSVVDLHADSLLWGRDLGRRSSIGHVDLPRLRAGGVALQVFTAVTRVPLGVNIERTDPRWPDLVAMLARVGRWPRETSSSLSHRALHQAARLESLARASEGKLVVVRSRADLERCLRARAADPEIVGAVLGIEGAHAVEGRLPLLFDAGFRLVGLAHFFDNQYAGSAHGLHKGGLSARGRDLVREMEALGMVLDLAHASPAAIEDALGMITRPPLVSHTGVKGTCPNTRNLSDEQIRGIAAAGGVIGIGFWKTAVGSRSAREIARAIGYVARLVGDDHVALGSDFDGAVAAPFDAAGLPQVTAALLEAGFTAESVRKVLGENALRIFRAVLPPE